MAINITVRLPWHMNGWNGTVCEDPKANTYCSGRFSYPGDTIATTKDVHYEVLHAGKHCGQINPPPCAMSCNVFGSEPIRCYFEPPTWFKGAKGIWAYVPPYTTHIWPYEQMYTEEVKAAAPAGRLYDNDVRRELARKYFDELVPNETILVYYANYSNPFSDEEKQRYIVVGIARLGQEVGREMFFEDVSEEIKKKYADGIIWQRALTSDYPEKGMRIPYELYFDNEEVLNNIIIEPDNPRPFKYASRKISDDDLITLVERLIGVADFLYEYGDTSQNWEMRQKWLSDLLSDLWKNRGAYPGFPQVLNYLDRPELAKKYLDETRKNDSVQAYEAIKSELISDPKINRTIKLKGKDKEKLLLEIIPRFNLEKEQIASLVDKDGVENGISASAKEVAENPYLLCEQYIGNNQDDVISFYQIDNGALPSPEYGIEKMTDANSAERFRALCVDALRWDNTHSFTPSERVLDLVNHRVSKMRDWRQNMFSDDYFEVDREIILEAITFRTDQKSGKLYLYLNEVYEDERLIEKTLKKLAARGDIQLKQPVTPQKFESELFESTSPLASVSEYAEAIKTQAKVCAEVFRKSVCVISGAAGTGKTSLVSRIMEKIRQTEGAGVSIKLLAPTGKAAERIREKTGKNATTIHSLIASGGWLNDNMTFKRVGGKYDKDVNTIIIDEASMVDVSLLATLFRAIQWSNVKRLILVGDPNQLPPIGRGKVFSDIIEWLKEDYPENIGELMHNIRQMENRVNSRGTGIVELAEIFIQEKQNYIEKSERERILKKVQEGGAVDKDLSVRYWQTATDLDELIKQELIYDLRAEEDEANLSEYWIKACDLQNNQEKNPEFLQVLSPFRGDDHGTDRLNAVLQTLLNERWASKFMLDGITLFDKVIQVVNRPESNPISAYNWDTRKNEYIEIFNGDMGFVYPHGFDKKKIHYMNMLSRFSVKFKGKENFSVGYGEELGKTDKGRQIKKEDPIDNLELAYAISVHKSQGSEFGIVYLVLPKRKSSTLSMELLYTAVTRAKGRLVLFIQEDISNLSCLTKIERSTVRRINSSVFKFEPLPEQLSYLPGYYEEYKVIATLAEYFVRSKSEALIANALHTTDLDFSYEKPLFAPDGTMYLPDFTITFRGNDYYWEHWGLLDKEKYAAHTAEKKKWYAKHFAGQLIESFEGNDISTQIKKICKEIFEIEL
ncbi:MAG: AAA family ATPase [Clostridiales bacterium]|nr:AAA family ATPase [Clostridiales bacterium]